MTTPRRSRAKAWTHTAGDVPYTVTASERLDRNRVVEVRWWNGEIGQNVRRSLQFSIRDVNGAIIAKEEQLAIRVTEACASEVRHGRPPSSDAVRLMVQRARAGEHQLLDNIPPTAATAQMREVILAPAPLAPVAALGVETIRASVAPSRNGTSARKPTDPLPLSDGFDLALAVPTGIYVAETEHRYELLRAKRDIVAAIAFTDDKPPRVREWNSIMYRDLRALWTELANRYVKAKRVGQKKGGPSWSRRCVLTMIQVGQWLWTEGHITHVIPIRRMWGRQMRSEWEQITGERIKVRKPRHSLEEVGYIFASLAKPGVDPRIKLGVELGAEARLGQVQRLMRSHVDLSPIGGFGLGRAIVHGEGNKNGVVRDLTPEERSALDEAFAGYLRDLEADYQAGIRDDYPVFPQGRLKLDFPPSRAPRGYRGPPPAHRAKRSVPDEPITAEALEDMFVGLERIAGVRHIKGRGWYGLRRRLTDIGEDYESDERILNDLTGHRTSEMRRRYQDSEDEALLARSAESRRAIRAGIAAKVRSDAPEFPTPLSETAPKTNERPARGTASSAAPKQAPPNPTPYPAPYPIANPTKNRPPGRRA